MGYTQAEFMQVLPSALRPYRYQVDDQLIVVEHPAGLIKIQLGEQQIRRIARLGLPYIPVTIDFGELNSSAATEFLQRFDLYYRRGGG